VGLRGASGSRRPFGSGADSKIVMARGNAAGRTAWKDSGTSKRWSAFVELKTSVTSPLKERIPSRPGGACSGAAAPRPIVSFR